MYLSVKPTISVYRTILGVGLGIILGITLYGYSYNTSMNNLRAMSSLPEFLFPIFFFNYQNIAADRSFFLNPFLGDDKCASRGTLVRDDPGGILAFCAPGIV